MEQGKIDTTAAEPAAPDMERLKDITQDNQEMQALAKRVPPILEHALGLEVTTQESKAVALDRAQGAKLVMKEIDETFDELITQAHQLHKTALAKKARWYDPVKQAFDTYVRKIKLFEQAEMDRQKAEARKVAEEQEAARRKALEAASKKLAALKDGVGNLVELRAALEQKLECDPELSDEEAQVLRTELAAVQAKLNAKTEETQKVETRVIEAAMPVTADMPRIAPEKEKGMAKSIKKKIRSINTKALMRAIVDGKVTIDPDQLMTWKLGKLTTIIQAVDLPGVSWEEDLDISVRAKKE